MELMRSRRTKAARQWMAILGILVLLALPLNVRAAGAAGSTITPYSGLTNGQQHVLYAIAKQTWRFYQLGVGVDAHTNLPLDNVGLQGAPPRGNYTSPTNIGVYLWSVVAALDLGLITPAEAQTRVSNTLTTVEGLTKWHGFLLSWYDTTNGHWITGPGGTDMQGKSTSGQFISTVDNGWYAAGLVVVRQALPQFMARATALLNAMDFGIFFDKGDQNTDLTAGQMYGGYIADQGPAGFHYGLLNTETRIAAYVGMGQHQMPGDVWWRTWRVLPSTNPAPPATTPPGCILTGNSNFDWQGQYPPQGYWTSYTDPVSGKCFTILEGHYTYNSNEFVPSWGGSMFEGLMPNLVVPETSWGTRNFGLNDKNYAQMQIDWATQGLHYPVWGLSPASTPDDTGGYDAFGAVGPAYPHALASNANCCPYQQYAVTPHASFLALDVLPQQAFANIQRLRDLYDIYGPYGFFDSVNPTTKSVGHRYLVLDQSMIMAALDNALRDRAMQRHFAGDPVALAGQQELSAETFSIH